MSQGNFFKSVTYWYKTYANPGITDQRAVETFMDCESAEAANGLRAELRAIATGNYTEQALDVALGASRRVRHKTYDEWARMMLIWMANYKPY